MITSDKKEEELRIVDSIVKTRSSLCSLYSNYSFPCCMPEYKYCDFRGEKSNCAKYAKLIKKAIKEKECYACEYWKSPSIEEKCKFCDEQSNFEILTG